MVPRMPEILLINVIPLFFCKDTISLTESQMRLVKRLNPNYGTA
jgi:hypothetical protein